MTRAAIFAAIAAFALHACATVVSSVSQDHVSIRNSKTFFWTAARSKLAAKECARFGRRAIFQKITNGEGLFGVGYAHYACVD